MGIIHHSVYPVWFEVARTDFLRHVGFSYSKLEQEGLLLAIIDMNCKFLKPTRYEERIKVRVSLTELKRLKMKLEYEVEKEDGSMAAIGSTTLGCLNKDLRPSPMPTALHSELSSWLSSSETP